MAGIIPFRRQCRKIGPFHLMLFLAILANLVVYLYLARHKPEASSMMANNNGAIPAKPGSITFVLRDFEDFENLVGETTVRAHNAYPEGDIVVVSDKRPYPPLTLPPGARIHTLQPSFNNSVSCLESVIQSEFVMLLPDGCDIISHRAVDIVLNEFLILPSNVQMLAWSAFALRDVQCVALQFDIKQWSLYFNSKTKQDPYCDALRGNFVLLMRTSDYLSLSNPFLKPTGESLFIQTAAKGWKVAITNSLTFRSIDKLFQDGHNRWKHQLRQIERQRAMYETLGVKYIRQEDGTEEWHGCSKKSNRCFPTIINDMPDYIYEGRWTPPCCLKALRMTARHVFTVLESEGVRYWLEGGSLLGAARKGDIIPWDYDIDIGIYKEDIMKSRHLYRLKKNDFEDDQGFVWAKATTGNFYQVHYSQSNRLHVDIFPFDVKDGIMTKDWTIPGHKQDIEFPEHYLKPLEKINFAGTVAFAPNNYIDFLEFKYGKGAIDNPKYPDLSNAVVGN